MGKQFDNTNAGALFKNDDKVKDSQPDYKGKINVDGTDYWLSAWLKTSKAGGKYMSLAIQSMEKEKPSSRPMRGERQEVDSDIPF